MAKRVAVIGAGASGLTAIKCCVEENLEPVCYERTDELGGLWNFTEKYREDQGCVMRSTIINSSKEMMAFSDFPVPKEFPNFMHNTQVWRYFKLYAKEFELNKHILYNKEVVSVKQTEDYQQTGRWQLQVRDHKTGSEYIEEFDAVLVCTGHHASKNMVTFQGQDKFQGKIIHSQQYKETKGFEGKRIVIVGIGNSAGDAAVELSRVGQVFLSTRRGSWVFNRLGENGIPGDLVFTKRSAGLITKLMSPKTLASAIQKQLNKRFDHRLYSLQPKHSVFSQHPMVNDDLPNRIASGSIKIKTDVNKFTRTGVEFTDGTIEDNIDVIILATGYVIGFPFIDKSVIDVRNNRVSLFKYIFPPGIQHQTLAIIGCVQPIGSTIPLAEMQNRLATRVFKGVCKLPSQKVMWADIKGKETAMAARYVQSQRHTIQVDYLPYMDELAQLIGCKPNIGSMLLSDYKLALQCYNGPCTPYQFRLTGPGAWRGAREAILTQDERIKYPLQTRPVPPSKVKGGSKAFLYVVLVAVVGVVYMIFF